MYIDTKNFRANYVLEGPPDQAVVMFSNSLGANLEMWEPQAQTLRERFRVLRYDQRGHGGSSVPPEPYCFGDLVDDAVALLDALEIKQTHFVGLSMGGMTALGLALTYPRRVASITVANAFATTPPAGVSAWQDRIETVRAGGLDSVLDATLERWFTADFRRRNEAMVNKVRGVVSATSRDGYIATCAAIKELNYLDRLGELTTPTLFIAGKHDVGASPETMREMHNRVRNARYIELDAAHVSNLEQPELFTEALIAFLDSL